MTNFGTHKILEPGDKPPENIFNNSDDDNDDHMTKQQAISLDSNLDMEPN